MLVFVLMQEIYSFRSKLWLYRIITMQQKFPRYERTPTTVSPWMLKNQMLPVHQSNFLSITIVYWQGFNQHRLMFGIIITNILI